MGYFDGYSWQIKQKTNLLRSRFFQLQHVWKEIKSVVYGLNSV